MTGQGSINQHLTNYQPAGHEEGGSAGIEVRRALIVDHGPAARRRLATLLQLAGWEVYEAVDAEAALRLTAEIDVQLVVTEAVLRGGYGPWLLLRLRRRGCRARALVVTTRPTARIRAQAAAAGAEACLAKPVHPRRLIDALRGRTTGPTAHDQLPPLQAYASAPGTGTTARPEVDRTAQLQEMYLSALPHRLSTIASSAQDGDAETVASVAEVLAGSSAQLGHEEIASVCAAIATDARRGVLAHTRLMRLVVLASRREYQAA